MKTKSSLLATAFTVALFSSAHADTTTIIDISGSTAGRSTIHTQLSAATGALAANFNGGAAVKFAFYKVGSNSAVAANRADGAIYFASTGTTPNKVNTVVRTFWAGSASGVNYVSNSVQLDNKFIENNAFVQGVATTTGVQLDYTIGANFADASPATVSEFGFSDVKQASTPYQDITLNEADCFVIPFKWVKTNTTDLSAVTNITGQQVRAHYTAGGKTRLSLFTGNAADNAKFVYAAGRDNDSGTRITAFAETAVGVFTTVTQWDSTVSDATASATLGTPVARFDGGYASGGNLSSLLGGTGFNYTGYLGVSDAATATGLGALELTYNGAPFSLTNIVRGTYTFWSTYQILDRGDLSGAALSLHGDILTSLNNLATAGDVSSVKLTDMKVTRESDGADVLPQ